MDNIFSLEQKYVAEMLVHARAETPNECCGILAGVKGKVLKLYRTTNAEHSPFRYSLDSRELIAIYREIESHGWELLAIYHSHTHTAAYPSLTDIKSASLPQSVYLIISLLDPNQPIMGKCMIYRGLLTNIVDSFILWYDNSMNTVEVTR